MHKDSNPKRPRSTPPDQDSEPEEAAPIRIAIADDHTIFRDGLRRLLVLQPDFEIVGEAENGPEVVALLDATSPDILLLDLRMPGLDGMALLKHIRKGKHPTKAIVLTASDDESDYVEAMRLGAAGIVLKHTATDLLMKSIRKVYSGEIWLDSRTTAAVMRQFAAPSEAPSPERKKPKLSKREVEIVVLVAKGLRNREIAEHMFISEQTVKNHLHNIFEKLGIADRTKLALYAIDNDIRPPTGS